MPSASPETSPAAQGPATRVNAAGRQQGGFTDGRSIPAGTIIDADVCIIGAGPAGITLALELWAKGFRPVLLEAGGLKPDAAGQGLYQGENVGLPYELDTTRCRRFGGSSNWWGGFCSPLDAGHFRPRAFMPYSGWPISREALTPYFRRAAVTCGLDPDGFAPAEQDAAALPAGEGAVAVGVSQVVRSRRRFGATYRRALQSSPALRVILNAAVRHLDCDAFGRSVTSARVIAAPGQEFTVTARSFVLATGAIENARLLLLSNRRHPAGLGNGYDVVGRFFMEHPRVNVAEVTAGASTADPGRFTPSFALLRLSRCLHLQLAPERREVLGIGGATGFFNIRTRGDDLPGSQSAKFVFHELIRGQRPPQLATHLRNIARDWTSIGHLLGWYGLALDGSIGRRLLRAIPEVAPNRDSRVSLSETRDALGLPKVRLDWRLSEIDLISLRTTTRTLCEALSADGRTRAEPLPAVLDGSWSENPGWTWHQMGTTRMGDDPRSSVVDARCRVHGMGNLCIAGSSVFPTAGNHTPTFTLLALAHRLADHLTADMRPAAPAIH
jgi:choline dehydrogenase-like flavoprotein